MTPTRRGLLRVEVDMTSEHDRGTLSVDPVTLGVPIKGDTSWRYTVK